MFLRVLALVLATAPALAHGEHAWIEKYKNEKNEPCCGVKDCSVVDPNKVMAAGGGYYLLPYDEFVPDREVLLSEDGHYWRCHHPNGKRKCFFVPYRGG